MNVAGYVVNDVGPDANVVGRVAVVVGNAIVGRDAKIAGRVDVTAYPDFLDVCCCCGSASD